MAATHAMVANAARLTELDRVVGDGDLGLSLGRCASRPSVPRSARFRPMSPPRRCTQLAGHLQSSLGGTSGPLYAVFFLRASARLKLAGTSVEDPMLWAEAFRSGCAGVIELGSAGRGDRTMLDALLPASDAFTAALEHGQPWPETLAAAAEAAERGAAATSEMSPRRGRSSYLGDRVLGHPDPAEKASPSGCKH